MAINIMSEIEYILGIDIGTTGVKVILISGAGEIIDETTEVHDIISLHPYWAEENPDTWWKNSCVAIQRLALKHPLAFKSLRAVGVSGMVPAIVLLDDKGQPLRNSIQQNDARATLQIARIKATLDQDKLYARTGGYTNQQHVLPRLLWVKENEPEVWSKVDCVMGSYDYIVYKLTGKKTVEINWAVESGLFDIKSQCWIESYLQEFDINSKILPEVMNSIDIVGSTRFPDNEIELLNDVPVISGSADHVASTLAAGILNEGDLLIKFGGAGDILYCIDNILPEECLFFDYHIVPNKYLLNGCMASSGSLVKWFTKDILNESSSDVLKNLDKAAEKIPPASDGLIILPYFLGEKTPIFDPKARGVFVGLTLSHTKAHIFRAILESVIYGFRHHIDILHERGYHPKNIIATNGGAKSSFWCQIAADVLNAPIKSYPSHPGSAMGVSFLAGMAVGVFEDFQQINKFLTESKIYQPVKENVDVYNKAYRLYRQIYPQMQSAFVGLETLYHDSGFSQ
jgi:xylulokinase